MHMKKIILTCICLASFPAAAGPYADVAKSKFESAMLEALQATNANQKK